jgi:hypothetical protein
MSDCRIVQPDLPDELIEKLVVKYATEELCPCALEEFNYRVSRNRMRDGGGDDPKGSLPQEGLKDALFRGVLNEMVLRSLAEEQACPKP